LPELAATPSAIRRLESPEVESRLRESRNASRVDHAAVMSTLRSILEPMAETLFSGSSARRTECDAFLAERPHLEAYARFRAAAAGVNADDPRFPQEVGYHLYAQWAAETQLAAAAGAGRPRAGLYLDLPVGVHPAGFDPVWEPAAFVPGVHGGAPPDIFQPAGQDWAFPPLHPQGLRSQEYRYLIAALRHAMRQADAVRIDHVMSLHRLYWIPAGADATDGVYVNYPDAEMRAVVALEASRSGTVVVGEDLGTVPAPVRADMRHDGMLRSWVLQFESTPKESLPSPPRQALASWGTHDLATFAGYWDGLDIDEREGRGDLDPRAAEAARRKRREWRRALAQRLSVPTDDSRAALFGCLDHLASSPAALVLVDLEDLWLEAVPQNRPGTGVGRGNWERRSARSLEEMFADPQVLAGLAGVDRRRSEPEASGRGGQAGRPRTMRRAG
jgi:4-alpha-glucanotransferase